MEEGIVSGILVEGRLAGRAQILTSAQKVCIDVRIAMEVSCYVSPVSFGRIAAISSIA